MKKKIQHSFGGNILNFKFPKTWAELSDEQLHYISFCMCNFPRTELKILVFIRFAGIRVQKRSRRTWLCSVKNGIFHKVRFLLHDWQVQSFIHQLDWLDQPPTYPVHLSCVGHFIARDVQLHDLPFGSYLICENLYQGYLYSKDSSYLAQMVQYLYVNARPSYLKLIPRHKWSEHELMTVFIWWMSVKNYFLAVFPHFFQPIDSVPEESTPDMVAQMNVQIRALTGGDVTKEDYIMSMDTWRALTELDAKALTYENLKKTSK